MLSKNIVANYVSQMYVTIIGIVLLPVYIKYMGSEAYGLVGFFTMLQAWFNLLDLGLTPTIGRETARYRGGVVTALSYRQLYRALTIIFLIIAIFGAIGLYLLSDLIVMKWLTLDNLIVDEVIVAVKIMAIIVALRWMAGLYRGVISGSEQFIWLSSFNIGIVTLRFAGVLVSMWYFGFTPLVFFSHQLLVAFIEIVGLAFKSNTLLPNKKQITANIGWSFKPVKPILKFSLTIAFTSSVWILVTQADKLVLSGILSLENYGYFTLGVVVANGVMLIGTPISNAVMPRMAMLFAEHKHESMIAVYRKTTQFVVIIAGSAAITLVVAAKPLLNAWTGQDQIAERAATILQLYSLGNLFLCLAAFAYYLQYAKGNLRYHFIGNIGLGLILIPCIIFAARYYGGVGAGYVWLIVNASFLFGWVAYIHHKLEPKLHISWLVNDVLRIIIPAGIVGFISWLIIKDFHLVNRMYNLLVVVGVGGGVLGISLLSSKQAMSIFKSRIKVL
ncbi:oligosaccharide flippase family protein [Shewanella glacialipiscicola]|uniref:oligosaccharide flippase family protein n=1 Tax=Shewanella glacialipiscicola TaxID=614069 RepID=UPI0021D933BD|nr:oligosaccharide flippase family protein [Shewanella glacialipiscicola]MCU7995608.1 oligosaccharide flippase family protein [Shewanella glacialipiscicola]MCU8026855.1 oligosaccharide flippase family protein [Shewanella glacialipiscicola]